MLAPSEINASVAWPLGGLRPQGALVRPLVRCNTSEAAAMRLRRNHMGGGIAGDIHDSERQRTWITTLPRACPVPT